MNLQAEIQELRAIRSGARSTGAHTRDDGHGVEDDLEERTAVRGDTALLQLSSVASQAFRTKSPPNPTHGGGHHNENARNSEAAEQQDDDGDDGDDEPLSTRFVQLITSDTGNATSANNGSNRTSTGAADALPLGWVRVTHDSGLPCYANEALRVVTWTKPYTLDSIGGRANFLALAESHVPPLSIFTNHRQQRRTENDPRMKNGITHSKKRKVDTLDAPEPRFSVRRSDSNAAPRVEINGNVVLDDPTGKSVHAFLREFATAAWKAVPQYNFNKNDDPDYPISCSVCIHDNSYPVMAKTTKQLTKEAAAEAVLEQHIPGYWSGLKKQGRVGKQQQQANNSKKQTDEVTKKASAEDDEPTMTLAEFKTLPIGDPRVLQACMDLSVKTPAQVIQEYQNRNRGISVNYNTVPYEPANGSGQKLFKTIVTAGSTAVEGVATTKKVAKQLAAQSLLVELHARSIHSYYEVADLYSSGHKGFTTGEPPLRGVGSHVGNTGNPHAPLGSSKSSPVKKLRRVPVITSGVPLSSSSSVYGGASERVYDREDGAVRSGGWQGYGGYEGNQNAWAGSRADGGGASGYGRKNERVVQYYGPPAAGGYGGPGGAAIPTGAGEGNGARGGYYTGHGDWSHGNRGGRPTPSAAYGEYPPPRPYPAAPPTGASYAPPPRPSFPDQATTGYSYGDPRLPGPYNQPKNLQAMEGYLLAFKKDRIVQLWFCVLEHGVLTCTTKANGALVESIQLTRHHIRVVESDDGGCPHQFAVYAMEAQYDEAVGRFRRADDKERVFHFAAPTNDKMRRWCRAIQNWKRHSFNDPTASSTNSTRAPRGENAEIARKAVLRAEAETLMHFVTVFGLRLKQAKAKSAALNMRMSMLATKHTSNRSNNEGGKGSAWQSLPGAATSLYPSLSSWIPSLRVPSWRRVQSSSS